MYKLITIREPNMPVVTSLQRIEDTAFIPFAPDNTDYDNFKKEVLAGAELQDADGNVMTQEQASEFVGGLA
jgi:hypothetical protein